VGLAPTAAQLAWLLQRGEVARTPAAVDLLDALRAAEPAAHLAFFRYLTVALERPLELHTETLPDGSTRLHRDDGPAVTWPDGRKDYRLHGVGVPRWVLGKKLNARRIHTLSNSEVRRVAVERLGWDRYLDDAGPVSTALASSGSRRPGGRRRATPMTT
jgi:hypothetical protein